MKNRLKILVLVILIIGMVAGIGFLIYNAVRSIKYNQDAKNPVVTLDVEGYGQVKMELYPDYAPNTVKHFIKLVQNGFYNGKVFYGTDGKAVNVGMEKNEPETPEEGAEATPETTDSSSTSEEKNAVEDVLRVSDIDTSVPKSETEDDMPTDENDPDYKISIDGEFVANGYDKNTLRFEYGVVGLYRTEYEGYSTDLSSESYNSGKSLFFIVTEEDSTLNGMYAGFGKVIEGMDIIEKINQLPVVTEAESETEVETDDTKNVKYFENLPVITKATVETYGVDYGMPEFDEAFDYDQYVSNLLLQYYSNQ